MKMFANNVAAAIKVAGKILKEKNGTFFLPFGSEYSIYLKNLNTVRLAVRISIDGQDVGDGTDFIVQPNSSLEIERFLKSGNLEQGNRLKFIERTSKIDDHRGIKIDDGLIRIEFQKEKVDQPDFNKIVKDYIDSLPKEVHHHHHHDRWHYPPYWWGPYYGSRTYYNSELLIGSVDAKNVASGSVVTTSGGNLNNITQVLYTADASVGFNNASSGVMRGLVGSNVNYSAPVADSASVNDAGITVPGSISDQKFTMVSSFPVESEKHVIVLKLLGETGGKAVEKAVTVKHKQTCKTCGTRNRGKIASFCRECGTALEVA